MRTLKRGAILLFNSPYAVNPELPPLPKEGDVVTIEGVLCRYRVVQVRADGHISTWRLEPIEATE